MSISPEVLCAIVFGILAVLLALAGIAQSCVQHRRVTGPDPEASTSSPNPNPILNRSEADSEIHHDRLTHDPSVRLEQLRPTTIMEDPTAPLGRVHLDHQARDMGQ